MVNIHLKEVAGARSLLGSRFVVCFAEHKYPHTCKFVLLQQCCLEQYLHIL